jgi:putative oxidoreductase
MSLFEPARSPWPSRVLSIVRIVLAFVFIQHGTLKLFDFPHMQGMPVPFGSLPGVAGMLEVVGGLLLLLGLLTRPVAFILCGEMAVAYFMGHAPRGLSPVLNGGEPAVFFCFWFLYLVFAGGGEWSLDTLLARKRKP